MASFTITSIGKSVVVNIDNRQSAYTRSGEMRILTDDSTGNIAYLLDNTTILAGFGERIIIDVSSDTINVNGTTSFANAGELVSLLSPVFFSDNDGDIAHKFGFNVDVDSGSPEILASFGGSYDPLIDVITTDQTFTITYNNSVDGLSTTGALSLLFTVVQTVGGVVVSNQFVHSLGNTGSDVTSFSGLGINRCVVLSSGSLGRNSDSITITATTDTTTQAEIPVGTDGRGTSVTEQLIFHTRQGYDFELEGIEINCLKLSGGQAPVLTFYLFSYSRVTNTIYRVISKRIDTEIENNINLRFGNTPFPFGGREVIFAEVESDQNNTIVNGQFYGKEVKA